jgi:hypothetical protein
LEGGEVFLKNEDIFGKLIELKGEQFIPDTFIFVPRESKMIVKGDKMVMKVFDYSAGAQPYIIFNYPEMKFIEKKGIVGNGPDEFLYADIIPTDDPSLLCYLFEMTNEKIYKLDLQGNITRYPYSFDSSVNRGATQKRSIYNLGKDDFIYTDGSKTGKSIFRSHMENDSVVAKEIISLQLNPNLKFPSTYIGDFLINKKKDRMLYAYKYFKILKFMDMEGKVVRTLNFQQEEFDEKSLRIADGLDNNVTHYYGVSAQKDFVYCYYVGRTPSDVIKDAEKEIFYAYIEQYDWNGNPIKKYKLDTWGFIYVDEDRNELLMVSGFNDDPFFRFKLE